MVQLHAGVHQPITRYDCFHVPTRAVNAKDYKTLPAKRKEQQAGTTKQVKQYSKHYSTLLLLLQTADTVREACQGLQ